MFFVALIVIGAVIGVLTKAKIPLLHLLPTVTLWLLLITVFLMGSEVDLRSLHPSVLLQAIGLSIAMIVGSVFLLSFTLYFFRRVRHEIGRAHV